MDPEIAGAKFAIRRARDIRGKGAAGGNNIFVGDRTAKGEDGDDDQLQSFRNYATVDFTQIVIDSGNSDRIGSDPEFENLPDILKSPMAYMDIGLQAEVYPA